MCRLVQAEENVTDAGGLSHIIYVWITKSVCSLLTAGEAGGLKYRRTVRNHFKGTDSKHNYCRSWEAQKYCCVFYCSSQHVTEKSVWSKSGHVSQLRRNKKHYLCVTDSMELFISRLRETNQRTPCACTNHEDSVSYWGRPINLMFKCEIVQCEYIQFTYLKSISIAAF